MVEQVVAEFGQIDMLINNAGILHWSPALEWSDEHLNAMFDVNVRGVLNCVQIVGPHLIRRRYGKIVNISSGAAFGTSVAGTTPYAATKAAVVALTKRLALEFGPHGINVNAVCPGFIKTDMVMASGTPEEVDVLLEGAAKKTVLGRYGEPEDVAAAAVFLVSDAASFVTAQILTVDGGRTDFLSHSA